MEHRDGEITVTGCLGNSEPFYLNDGSAEFRLIGDTDELTRLAANYHPITVRGKINESTHPATINVISVRQGKTAKPRLNAEFRVSSHWRTEKNLRYGVKFAHPESFEPVEPRPELIDRNFVSEDGAELLGSFGIPRGTYPDSTFVGASFSISVNPKILNRESCEQFGDSEPRFLSSQMIGNVKYSKMSLYGVAAGTADSHDYFNTFQNGLCYEAVFVYFDFNPRITDFGCTTPVLTDEDVLNIESPLIRKISFFRPTVKAQTTHGNPDPQVASLTSSSDVADDAKNRGLITFSWSTRDADYVEFTYLCSDEVPGDPVRHTVILEAGQEQYCANGVVPPDAVRLHRPPNSSVGVLFGDFRKNDEQATVTVTMTPYSHGIPYSKSSRSLTITVNPYAPFPGGVIPNVQRNLRVFYPTSTDAPTNYTPGSSVTIRWTDTHADPCVNLYLGQENADGTTIFRSQLNRDGCLQPSGSGSFTWTIPAKFSGAGFRIYASTPGGVSAALGAAFSISQ